jgi:hypothetical protein
MPKHAIYGIKGSKPRFLPSIRQLLAQEAAEKRKVAPTQDLAAPTRKKAQERRAQARKTVLKPAARRLRNHAMRRCAGAPVAHALSVQSGNQFSGPFFPRLRKNAGRNPDNRVAHFFFPCADATLRAILAEKFFGQFFLAPCAFSPAGHCDRISKPNGRRRASPLRVWGACRGAPGLPTMMHHPGSRASNLYHITAPLR